MNMSGSGEREKERGREREREREREGERVEREVIIAFDLVLNWRLKLGLARSVQ